MTGTSSGGGLLRITGLADASGFRIEGEVDLNSRAALAAALAESMHGGGDIVVDLSGARFIDVEGMRMLVHAARGMTAGRVLVLRGCSPIALRLLELMNSDDTLALRVEPGPGGGLTRQPHGCAGSPAGGLLRRSDQRQ